MVQEINKSTIDESIVLELLDKEIEENQRATHIEYVDMIEKIQGVLTNVEYEKDKLKEQNQELSVTVAKQIDKIYQLTKENQNLKHNYDDILSQMDILNMKKSNIESEKNELVAKIDELRYKYERIQKNEAEDNEKRFLEFNIRTEQLANENRLLQDRLSSLMSAKSSSEDIHSITQTQLQETTLKLKTLIEENEKMRQKIDTLFKEKADLLNVLESRVNEIDDLKRKYKYDLERLSIEHANVIKDLTSDHRKERDRTVTGLGENLGPGLYIAHSNLSEFMLDENDRISSFRHTMEKHSLRDLMKRSSIAYNRQTDDFRPPVSEKFIEMPIPEEQDQEICYLEQLEEKDKEISKLREHITELKEKASKEIKVNPQQEEQIKKLMLDLKHEKEIYDMLVKTVEKEREHAGKTVKEIEDMLIQTKLKYQLEVDDKDRAELQLMKKIKLLNYHIKLYEDQINAFNKTPKK